MPTGVVMYNEHIKGLPFNTANMKVYKFGGASINSNDRIQNMGNIIQANKSGKLLVIISAMGKTTNALEKKKSCGGFLGWEER